MCSLGLSTSQQCLMNGGFHYFGEKISHTPCQLLIVTSLDCHCSRSSPHAVFHESCFSCCQASHRSCEKDNGQSEACRHVIQRLSTMRQVGLGGRGKPRVHIAMSSPFVTAPFSKQQEASVRNTSFSKGVPNENAVGAEGGPF